MKRPLIGINCKIITDDGDSYYKLDRNYVRSVERAGGEPLMMPAFRSPAETRTFLDRLDGVLFTGGPDINPKRWRERPHPKVELLDPYKEDSDFAAIRETLSQDKPLLGVCLGCQLLNVATGGSLHQHIPDLKRRVEHGNGARHGVSVERPSRLSDIVKRASIRVLSYHHQGIDRLGKGLIATARAEDGLVEAVEDPGRRFAVAVQWHPERMTGAENLFQALVSEASRP